MSNRRKPAALRAATGNPGHRPIPEHSVPDTGDAVKPKFLQRRPRASELWEEYAPPLRLLGTLRKESGPLFATWCWLMSSFEKAPDAMTASKVGQIRFLASSLGMDPSSQGKFCTPKAGGPIDPEEAFFTGPRPVRE